MSEKNLPPSQHRLRQAREQGQISVSQDVVKLLKLGVVAETAFATEPWWRPLLQQQLSGAAGGFGPHVPDRLAAMWGGMQGAAIALIAVAILAGVLALAGTIMQTRFNIAPKALQSGLKRLDPAGNLRQLVSAQKLLTLLLAPLKIGSILVVNCLEVRHRLPELAQLYRASTEQGWAVALSCLQSMERKSLLVLVCLAALDYALQRHMHMRGLRMELQEVRREHKEHEGDPRLKGHRKSLAREIALQSPEPARNATAVVVNPEHLAIALAYDFARGGLPRVVGKGRGAQADALRELAATRRIPIIKYVGLARRLYAVGREGVIVPTSCLRAVALLYQAVQELDPSQCGAALQAGLIHELDEQAAEAMLAP